MNIQIPRPEQARRTTTDDVFERLHAEIVTLGLAPGTKLSEMEVARQFDVSRQPVREAFIRLSNASLVQIRPQKATVVRKISVTDIRNARFVRTAVEVEVIRKACQTATATDLKAIRKNLQQQKRAAKRNGATEFHDLDYAFHHLICVAAQCEFAFETIAQNKSQVDRLCMLSLADKDGMQELVDDHVRIADALEKGMRATRWT